MTAAIHSTALKDELAISLANSLALANQSAINAGVTLNQSKILISLINENGHWQIHYLPNEGVNRRGGDYIVEVDPIQFHVVQTWLGQ